MCSCAATVAAPEEIWRVGLFAVLIAQQPTVTGPKPAPAARPECAVVLMKVCTVTFGPPLRAGADEAKDAFLDRAAQSLLALAPKAAP